MIHHTTSSGDSHHIIIVNLNGLIVWILAVRESTDACLGYPLGNKYINTTFALLFLNFSESVTKLELAGTTVELCTYRHLCSSLGCYLQPYESINRNAVDTLCQCDPECAFFNDCCQDYSETCQPLANEGSKSHMEELVVSLNFGYTL